MKKNNLSILSILLCLSVFVLWNCNGPKPTSPTSLATVSVAVPVSGGQNDAFAATNDIIEYVVTGPGMSTVSGSTTISNSTVTGGTVNFSVNVQSGPQRTLAIEAKDLASNQPLALGAVQFDLSSNATTSNLTVELGSLTRTCYVVNNPLTDATTLTNGTGTYSFANDMLTSTAFIYGPGWDIQVTQDTSFQAVGYYFNDAGSASYPGFYSDIAYMGNGDLVNFAYVPDSSLFNAYSSNSKQIVLPQPTATPYPVSTVMSSVVSANRTNNSITSNAVGVGSGHVNEDLVVGDVYCIAIQSIPGAHAWVQITSAGVQGVSGPAFIFRANSTLPYFAFQRTGIDTGPGTFCNSN